MTTSAANRLARHIRLLIGASAETLQSDGQLLDRFVVARDESAFEILVRRYGRLVFGVCRRVLRETTAAEDAFQATFLVLLRKATSLDRRKPLAGWLHTVAYRLALRARASEARRRACETQAALDRPEAMTAAARSESPLALGEELLALEEELQRLPEKHRAPLVLCYLEGMTGEQAAQALGCPKGSMSWRLAQARDALRERLSHRGFAVPAVGLTTLFAAASAPAAVPLVLIENTVRAAVWFATEGTVAGVVSAQAVILAKGALRTMMISKLKIATGLLLAFGLVGGGTTLWGTAAIQTSSVVRGDDDNSVVNKTESEKLPAGALARMGSGCLGHGDVIFFAAYLPDGKSLLTAGHDQTLRLWDLKTGKELRRFDWGKERSDEMGEAMERNGRAMGLPGGMLRGSPGTMGGTFQVALSRDGKLVAANRGSTVLVWDTATGKKLHQLKTGHQLDVGALAFAADGKSLATVGHNPSVVLWDLATGKEAKRLGKRAKPGELVIINGSGVAVALSPDSKYLAYGHLDVEDMKGAESTKFSVKIRDLESGKELRSVKADIGEARTLAFSPDGKTLAVAGLNAGAKLWDVIAGKERASLKSDGGELSALAFSPDSKILAVGILAYGRKTRTAGLYEVASGKKLRQVGKAPPRPRQIVVIQTGREVISGPALAFAPDGKTLVAGLDGNNVRSFEVATGKEIAGPSHGHHAAVSAMALSADGKTLLTYGRGDPVYVWDAATGKELRKLALPANISAATFATDGKTFATSANGTVTLWNAAIGKELKKINAEERGVRALALSPDGKVLATRDEYSPAVRLWNTETGKELRTLTSQAAPDKRGAGFVIVAESPGVRTTDVVFSPDGRFLAGAGAKRQLCLWNAATSDLVWETALPPGGLVEQLAFSADGRTLGTLNSNGTITLYETATGEKRARLGEPDKGREENSAISLGGMEVPVFQNFLPVSLAFSPDGRHLAAAKGTAVIRVWDLLTGKECGKFEGHKGSVASLAFNADGKRLISGSIDTTALSWDVGRLAKAGPTEGDNMLDAKALEVLWSDLASKDAEKGFTAIGKLSASPASAAYLKEHVRPAAAPEAKRITQLIADLENDAFAVRKKAETELEALGELAEPQLRKALDGDLALDLRQRLQRLLQKQADRMTDAGRLRDLRAVEVLEALATPEAQQVLETLAKGAEGGRLTREAKAALKRLTARR